MELLIGPYWEVTGLSSVLASMSCHFTVACYFTCNFPKGLYCHGGSATFIRI